MEISIVQRIKNTAAFLAYAAVIFFAVLLLGGCMASKSAAAIRYELAAESRQQALQSADEAELFVQQAVARKSEETFAELARRYCIALDAAGNDPQKVALATAEYIHQVDKHQALLEAEAEKAMELPAKMRRVGDAVREVNRMADAEMEASRSGLKEFVNSGLPDTIVQIIEEAAKRNDAVANLPPTPAPLPEPIPEVIPEEL